MTTCPNCDDIRIYRSEDGYYRLNCKCGHAWNWSSACRDKYTLKENWERLNAAWEQNSRKEPKE